MEPTKREWWWEDAACRGEWELFDSLNLADHALAKRICARCPVFAGCVREVVEIQRTPGIVLVGTWAGILYGDKGNANRRVS